MIYFSLKVFQNIKRLRIILFLESGEIQEPEPVIVKGQPGPPGPPGSRGPPGPQGKGLGQG